MKNEQVLCVHRRDLPPAWLERECAVPIGPDEWAAQMRQASACWLGRAGAEVAPDHKQLIPYAIARRRDGRLAVYPRAGSEARLHGLHSIGIGGHINPEDAEGSPDPPDWILRACLREIHEEFACVAFERPPRFLGVINEEHTPVGHVHLGLVYVLEIADEPPPVPGEELQGLQWIDPDDEAFGSLNVERWSRLALRLLQGTGDNVPAAGLSSATEGTFMKGLQ
jgi:predicted NUDIX family phosphoesterase